MHRYIFIIYIYIYTHTHINVLQEEEGGAGDEDKTSDWACQSYKCNGHLNFRKSTACSKCGAMRRIGVCVCACVWVYIYIYTDTNTHVRMYVCICVKYAQLNVELNQKCFMFEYLDTIEYRGSRE
jgi:hypothetical protein